MESLLQHLSIARLFRWLIVGALFLVAADPAEFGLSNRPAQSFTQTLEKLPIVTLLGLSTVLGGFLYGIYRSMFFPVIEALMIRCFRDKCGKVPKCELLGIPDGLLHMLSLWDQDAADSLVGLRQNRHKRISDWGDIMHSQLAGAFMGIAGGACVLFIRRGCSFSNVNINWILLLLFAVLLASGLVSFVRLLKMQDLIDASYSTNALWRYSDAFNCLEERKCCGE